MRQALRRFTRRGSVKTSAAEGLSCVMDQLEARAYESSDSDLCGVKTRVV